MKQKDQQIDLHIDNGDLLDNNLNLLADTIENFATRNPKDIANEFINKLQDAYTKGNLQHLSYLYDNVFNKLSSTAFATKRWPSTGSLAENDQIKPVVIQLYNELSYRHVFSRLNSTVTIQTRLETYKNYLELLSNDFAAKELEKNQLPANWIWDILDEFVYQFVSFCFYKNKLGSEGDQTEVDQLNESNLPTLSQVTDILQRFLDNSGVLDEKQRFKDLPNHLSSQQIFGYYAYAAKIKLFMSTGQFDDAKQLINYFDYKVAQVFTKAWSSLINLFYFSGLNYFKNHQFVFCGRLLEQIIIFYLKYNRFFSK